MEIVSFAEPAWLKGGVVAKRPDSPGSSCRDYACPRRVVKKAATPAGRGRPRPRGGCAFPLATGGLLSFNAALRSKRIDFQHSMGKQHNKVQKRVRRKGYLKRKAEAVKAQAALGKKSPSKKKAVKEEVVPGEATEPAAAPKKAAAKKAPAKKAPAKKAAAKKETAAPEVSETPEASEASPAPAGEE